MWGTKGWDVLSPGTEVVKGEAWELPWPSVPPYRRSQWARNWSWQAERVKCLGCIWAPDYILSKTLLPPCHSYCLTVMWNIKIASLNFPFLLRDFHTGVHSSITKKVLIGNKWSLYNWISFSNQPYHEQRQNISTGQEISLWHLRLWSSQQH